MKIKKAIEKVRVFDENNVLAGTVDVQVELVQDEVTGEWCYTPESMEKIDEITTRKAGLLFPWEMVALRKRLGVSQARMCELLKIGAKTWHRWEKGLSFPDPAYRQTIRMLNDGKITLYDLTMEEAIVYQMVYSPILFAVPKTRKEFANEADFIANAA